MNRIQEAIFETNRKLKSISNEKVAAMDRELQETLPALVTYQESQARAFASGKLSQAEAASLYRIYGGECPSPERWAKQSLAARIVATRAAAELLLSGRR